MRAQTKKTPTAMGKVHTKAGPAVLSPNPNPENTAVVALMTENPRKNDETPPTDRLSFWVYPSSPKLAVFFGAVHSRFLLCRMSLSGWNQPKKDRAKRTTL